ncbi:cell envelope integrity protein TolA [Psychromonas sp. KJ10-10]|uniref:cell envelope integrity protein TolA n=1 Tax=Psychromonas sp. KJ10-10 TaxID=3391823 RepID=UPI0039B5C8AA
MKNSTTFIAFITALALHLIVGAVMLLGLDFDFLKDKPKPEATVINASMINQKLFDDLAEKKAQQKSDVAAAEKRELEQKRQEQARIQREKELVAQKIKQAEEKRIKEQKAEAERKQKEEERILLKKLLRLKKKERKKKLKKQKRYADAKRKQEEERIRKQKEEAERVAAEKLKAEKALQEKLAKEAKIKAEKEEKERQEKLKAEQEAKARKEATEKAERLRQAELDKQMQEEFEDSFSSAQSSKQLSEIARYQALIRDKISRNWQIDPSMKGKSCTLAIRLAPDGLVLNVTQSKGDAKLCDSAKRATFKAKILPIPKDPEIAPQFRDFDITLEPEL